MAASLGCAIWLIAAPVAFALDDLQFAVEGDDDLREQLRNSSLLVAAQTEGVSDPQELLAAALADYGRLIGSLYNQGYYGGVINILVDGVEATEISPLARLNAIDRISVRVAPGPSYRFSRAEIGPLAPDTVIPEEFAVGGTARSVFVEDAANAAVSGWRDVGNAKARIADQSAIAQHDQNTLAVAIDVAPGPRVTFGNLILRGSEAVRPERLRAIAGLPTGEVFDPDELQGAADRLRRTQVFSSVALIENETLGPGNTMDIVAQLAGQPPRRIGFGAEVSTVEGVGLTAFWLHRNLFGGAERFRIDGSISGIGGSTGGTNYSLDARFQRPATFSPHNTFFIDAELARLDEPDYTSDVGTLGFGIERLVNDEVSISYGLAYRFSQVEDDAGERNYSMLTLPLTAVFDNREQPLDAKGGAYVNLTATPFLGLNEQTDNGTRITFDARSYLSFGQEERVTLAGRLQGGSIVGADLAQVPNEYRFYSGGGGSVRGQQYQSLGITLDGVESGGASYLGLSAEIRTEITESIGVVAFADYGLVGPDATPGSDANSHSGAGLGLRYLTPIGPIRLDVAAPIDGPDDPSGIEVYIGIGQAF
ncbi:autotransporter assembly complex family protein [Palleronia sp. LCG004]|uniref:autotransporter assembly complex protein TamA n=1 Tax=Palleronia sp. LCG004 TaxID=3079304 RepID=UPI0029421F19|nr:autotransporter assembly complex family protein [Palleronia sp. LCG004]WOI56001.1 autotransporter assembly complex family protein [Palleronia sp. LCG004]